MKKIMKYNIYLKCSFLYNLCYFTGMIDASYNEIQTLKRSIQDELRATTELLQRYELEFYLQRLDTLAPMSAGGFFSITNGNLTSMLSVRLE